MKRINASNIEFLLEQNKDRVVITALYVDEDNRIHGFRGTTSLWELAETVIDLLNRVHWKTSINISEYASIEVPKRDLVIQALRGIAAGLRSVPRGGIRDEEGYVAWSVEEEKASVLAAALLDLAAGLLEEPSVLETISCDKIEALIKLARGEDNE